MTRRAGDGPPLHFVNADVTGALCGAELADWGFVWRNDLRADCEACCEIHRETTGWSFPLPDLIG